MAGMNGLSPAPDYAVELPDEEEILQRLNDCVDYWSMYRDPYIVNYRAILAGENEVKLPEARGYVPVTRHGFQLRAIHNANQSRFGLLPKWAALPSGQGEQAEKDSEKVERWIRSFFYENERKGNSFWSAAVEDLDQLDEAWFRVDRAPAADWPDLVPFLEDEESEDATPRSKLFRLFESDEEAYEKAKDSYKVRAGCPIRVVHVPLQNVYPAPSNAGLPPELFELSEVMLREVLGSTLYDAEALDDLRRSVDRDHIGLNEVVSIVRYSNQSWFAYYLMQATNKDGRMFFPAATDFGLTDATPAGATLLYADEHGLGRIPYSRMAGASGGWRTREHRQFTGVGNALCNIQQYIDEVDSQIATRIRRNGFSTYVLHLDKQARPPVKGKVSNPQIEEGGTIEMYLDEKVEVLPELPEDQNAFRYRNELLNAMGSLGGSPAQFGQHVPGVDNGYQNAQAIAQTESLAEMKKAGLQTGAIDLGVLVLEQARVLNERLPVTYIGEDQTTRKQYAETLWLEPKSMLDPMPTLDAKVTKPAPQDWPVMARVYLDLTSSQGGKPSAVTRRWGMENLLGIDQPAEMERALLLQDFQDRAVQSEVPMQMIMNELNLMVAQSMNQQATPVQAGQADPALLATLQGMNQGGMPTQPGSGGVAPGTLNAIQGGIGRRVGGLPYGSATPESVIGQQVASRERMGVPLAP